MSMSDPLADAQAQYEAAAAKVQMRSEVSDFVAKHGITPEQVSALLQEVHGPSGALTVPQPRAQALAAQQGQQAAKPEPVKPALDADTIRAISDLAAAPGSADMASIREVMTNGRDLAQIVEGVALIAFRGRRAAGEGWRELCPALHKTLMEAHFVATA